MADYDGAITLPQARDCNTEEEEEEEDEHMSPRSGGAPPFVIRNSGGRTAKTNNNNNSKASGGVSMVEVTRKPRGRPPGSKNKPKPPIVITMDSESAMKPVILELSAGSDLFEMVSQFARRQNVNLCIVSGSGTVANVTLRYPAAHASTLTLHGPFHILSLSGTFLASSTKSCSSSSSSSPFTISLAGAQGQVFGGTIAGSVIAAGPVIIVAASFVNPSFHRLPGDNGEGEVVKSIGGGVGESNSNTSGGMAMSVYGVSSPSPLNCQIPSPDVLPWVPNSRPHPY